jgi:hypothetical protein
MIYDKEIVILKLPDTSGTLLQGKLQPTFQAYCRQMQVFHQRFWESVQAGSRIDAMVELPLHRDVTAGMFAMYQGHVHSVEQAQFGEDPDGLPVTILSLKRTEDNYDVAAV